MVEKDYYGFLDEVADKLQAAQNPFSGQIRVNVKDVEKANGMSYRGIVVADDQLGMGVTINMDKHYKMYLAGKPVDEIVDLVQQQAMDAFEERPDVDISRVKDYESLCSNVMMEAVSREKNAEYLQDVPHFDMADLSIIYRVNVGESRNQGIGVITVDNRLLNSMGVSQDQFQKDVFDQVLSGDPPILKPLTEVLGGSLIGDGSEMDGGLFLATNSNALYGASVIAIPGFLDQAAEKIGGSFYILPSSVHEVLLLKNDQAMDVQDLENMVQEINESIVSPEEQLSDRVYHYDAKEKVFELASDYEQRIAEKDPVELEAAAITMDYLQYKMDAGGERYEAPAYVSVEADRNLEALMKGDTALMESFLQEMIDRNQSPEMTMGAKNLLARIDDFKDRFDKTHVQEQAQESVPGISFYVAEYSEYPILGEFHDGLTLREAFETYQGIPQERLGGKRSIGFQLENGEDRGSMMPMYIEGQMQTDKIIQFTPYGENHAVMEALHDLEKMSEAQMEMDASSREIRENPDKGIGSWSVKMQGIDPVQEEASGRMKEQQSVSEMRKEGPVVSDSRGSVKTDRAERKSVLGALQDKKEQVRTADGGRQEHQKTQNRPRNRNEIGI